MVDFLLQEDTCEILINYITQINETGECSDEGGEPVVRLTRPGPVDAHTDQLKLAYKTMMLLTSEEPTEGLLDFLKQRATLVAKLILNIFQDNSAGSFFHVYRVYELLARYYPDNVFEALCAEDKCTERMTFMLRYIGYAPISELIVMMVGISTISRTSLLYTNCEKSRIKFINVLADWKFLERVAEVVVNPEENCYTGAYVDLESHSLFASLLFQELVEKFSAEEIGQQLLNSLTDTSTILDILVHTVVDKEAAEYKRQNSAKILYFLLRRAADEEMTTNIGMNPNAMVPNYVANRLYNQRSAIINIVGKHLPVIVDRLITFSAADVRSKDQASRVKIPEGPLQFTTYQIAEPFTTLRTSLVELVVILVESDEHMADHLTSNVWKLLLDWCMVYAHNNVYHTLFYRLVFAILRQKQEAHHRCLFQASKFCSFLVDTFLAVPFQLNDAGEVVTEGDSELLYDPPRKCSPELTKRFVARCLIMNCAHAIRLQCASQSPTSFLPMFLAAHTKWSEFLPNLIAATENQHRFGMGIQVTDLGKPNHNMNALMGIVSDEPQIDSEGGINHGSTFAKNLGFMEDNEWEEGDADDANYSRSSILNMSDEFEESVTSVSSPNRLSCDGRSPGATAVASNHFLSPTTRGSLNGPGSMFFDKDNQEDADIIDGITSPLEAMEMLEKRRDSIGQDDSPLYRSQLEPKISPHERKQLFDVDDNEVVTSTSRESETMRVFLELESQSQSDLRAVDSPINFTETKVKTGAQQENKLEQDESDIRQAQTLADQEDDEILPGADI